MRSRRLRWGGLLTASLAFAATALATDAAAQSKNRKSPPATMPPLPPAVIDDTLTIGGEDIGGRKVRTRMTVAVQVNGRGPYHFVVDSGADTSVIGARLARGLQLPLGKPVMVHGMTGSRQTDRVIVDTLGLGHSELSNLHLPMLQDGDIGAAGMIGIDALVEQRLMLDFEKRLIKVEDARRPPQRMDGEIVVTARRRRGQLILTQARANGRQVDAVVDTGSEITIGNIALRDRLVRRYGSGKLTKIAVTGVTGVTVDMQLARIAELQLGPVVLRDILIAFADVPPFAMFGLVEEPALLLGTDLMETFRRVSLDFRARKVRFQLRRCESTGITISTSPATSLSHLSATRDGGAACR